MTVQQLFEVALQHHQAGRLPEAEQIYRQILATQPNHATAMHHLGLIALQVGRKLVAVNLIRRAIALDPNCAEAYNNLGNALSELKQLEEAADSYRHAIALKPDYAAAYNNLGALLKEIGELEDAVTAFRKAINIDPAISEAHYNLADLLTVQGQLPEAIASYHRSIQLAPEYAEAHNNLGHALHLSKRLDEAIACIRQALRLRPEFAEAHCNLASVLTDQGEADAAMVSVQRAIQIRPDYAQAHLSLGNLLVAKGEIDAGIGEYELAILILPDFVEAHNNLGNALKMKGNLDQAVACYRTAIEHKSDCVEALYNLGCALQVRQKAAEAVTAFNSAIALKPEHAEAHVCLADALRDDGKLDEAIESCLAAIRIEPRFTKAYISMGNAFLARGQVDKAVDAYRQAIAIDPGCVQAHSMLMSSLNFHPDYTAVEISRELENWEKQHARFEPMPLSFPQPRVDADRPLRVGYVSGDFYHHAVAQNLVPLFNNRDRERFEMICYADVRNPDAFTVQFKRHADLWRDISSLTDEQVAELVQRERIDILVDLSLHTPRNRLLVFARKPAPVQVTFVGYPGSTGLHAIDYRLSDPYLDPVGMDESIYSEKTIRLPDNFWCYDPLDGKELRVSELPFLAKGFITFGCLNTFVKVNDKVIDLWTRVLQQVEGSRLLLLAKQSSHLTAILDRLDRAGISSDRIEFAPRKPRVEYLQLYNEIDIGLDTFPYNGHTTSLDSYWMGVPVVTLVGETAVSRAGWCHLSNLRLTEFAAHTPDQFVEIAIALAKDLPRLAEMRATLRQRMIHSPLMDGPKFARSVEAAYQQMWRTWRDSHS